MPEPYRIVAIGSSTGGPSALAKVLGGLPADLGVPVVIAQHIADGFVPGLVSWLDGLTPLTVKMAQHGDRPKAGVVYLSPTGGNLRITREGLVFAPPGPDQLYIPSADELFASTARAFGARAVGVILTGMGNDGAAGLKMMAEAGAMTIAQDEKTSVVFGMPKAAADLGAAREVLSIDRMAERLTTLCAVASRA